MDWIELRLINDLLVVGLTFTIKYQIHFFFFLGMEKMLNAFSKAV